MSFFKRETPHNHKDYAGLLLSYYTIPRNNRELQPTPITILPISAIKPIKAPLTFPRSLSPCVLITSPIYKNFP